MMIRDELRDDGPTVRQVVIAAFDGAAEADLVDALRASGDAVISLIAEDEHGIAGHILFSELQAPARCIALAPVSVKPDRQKQGIGSKLILDGLERAKRDGWQAVFVLGDPKYYGRFGFLTASTEKFDTEYPRPYFMALELKPHALSGRSGAVIYAPAFLALDS